MTIEFAYWALGIGFALAGVGIQLWVQGAALKRDKLTRDIGKWSYTAGLIWAISGFIVFLWGFCIWLITK
jgi:hypothetical protein